MNFFAQMFQKVDLGTLAFLFVTGMAYVCLNTVRILMVDRGYNKIGSLLAVFEELVYMVGLVQVIPKTSQSPVYLIVYVIGFGVGVLLGAQIIDKLKMGMTTFNIVTHDNPKENVLAPALRDAGFGVTEIPAKGLDGKRKILYVLAPQSQESELIDVVKKNDPAAFVSDTPIQSVHGGFWTTRVEKRLQRKQRKNAKNEVEK